jgi:Spy/CpxP family protein refolding chaperone
MYWFRGAILSVLLITVLATAIPFPVAAYSNNTSQAKPEKLWQELNLTPQQKQKIGELHRKSTVKMRAHQQALSNAQKELNALNGASAPANKISQKQNQIDNLKQKIADLRKQYTAAMKEILTAEQWAKLQKLKKERQETRNEV